MKYGVPQVSIIGPSLFSIYLYPLPYIISKYPNIYYHLYADDKQLNMFLPTNSSPYLNIQFSNCVNDIKEWFISNNLLLNSSKTTLLNLSPSPTYFPPFLIDNIVISPSPTASNLGVLFDSTLSLFPHITAITKSANYHLSRIRKIPQSTSVFLTKTLVNSLVLSRIDYYSSILINLPLSSIFPLNRVIRSSIRTTLFCQHITYVFEIIPLLPHTNTYLHGSHLTNALLIAHYILFIPQYTLQIAPPIFLLL